MKQDFLEHVKSRGYWRINFQPSTIVTIKSLEECLKIVEKSVVSLRGWNFPHVPRRNDDVEGLLPSGDFYESWSNWGANKEFWRIYKSTQFIMYQALREDWYEVDGWYAEYAKKITSGSSLAMFGSLIYQLTEVTEFLSRLAQQGLYQDGVKLNISLHNTAKRQLWIDGPGRMPFAYPRITGASEIKFEKNFSLDEIKQSAITISNEIIFQFMDSFGFNPDPNSIVAEQDKLLSKQV